MMSTLDDRQAYSFADRPEKCRLLKNDTVQRTDWQQRAFTVGVGGPMGSGKTTVVLRLCEFLRSSHSLCVVTNDFLASDGYEHLCQYKALPEERMFAVETGGCSHAAIREDILPNYEAVETLTEQFQPDMVLIDSGGNDLITNFSRELADFTVYVIDVGGGQNVPRKGGPVVTGSDLLVVNKIDMTEAAGADLEAMQTYLKRVRPDKPTLFISAKHKIGIPEMVDIILHAQRNATTKTLDDASSFFTDGF